MEGVLLILEEKIDGVVYVLHSNEWFVERVVTAELIPDVYIVPTIQDMPVTCIAQEAFEKTTISSIEIPDTVEGIGPLAFYGCDKLEIVHIYQSGCNFVAPCLRILQEAFSNCKSLVSVIVSTATPVRLYGDKCFNECINLYTLDADFMTTIPAGTFNGCVKLEHLYVKGDVKFHNTSLAGTNIININFHNTDKIIASPKMLNTLKKINLICNIDSKITDLAYEGFLVCIR